ncbi:hypothetical protein JQX09_25150, partial [Sulfitobacter pseudonitzschiae]|nr:hypothetical protein [Pseudosulfitobacter pseudonitzschiae]MBM2300092.1 hypothetical protein [Pseudosulfitobacter pseudonitzschiae]MBM2319709.1 hypothetical protein [Pseudosulfitobacter pseudonitzschiae]MBM2329288.1 hypothetical protein [Pseudosulfitobacter pseudonitzschiae]MBM2338877.1 hypothetical protein [Pseudosulfitobacter pseudonitzschiae]
MGTVTPILIDGSNVTDIDDTLNVVISGDGAPGGVEDVDADFSFTVVGTDGTDTFTKNNFGTNNDIDWDGGLGNDIFSIGAGDLGASTAVDGNEGTDTLNQLQGTFVDDDFISVSSMEVLTGVNQVMATLGAEADEAGIVTINGGGGNDNVLLDVAFDNDLSIDLSSGGDDTIDAGTSSSAVTFSFDQLGQLTSGDVLTGGTGAEDTLNLDFFLNGTADASNVNGVEIINLGEDGGSSFNLILGNTTNDNANDALTINEARFDGEIMNVDGSAYQGDITYNGQVSGAGAVSNVETGSGNDSVFGGNQADTLVTNDGNDSVDGGTGNDTINSGSGDDSISGDEGNDVLNGGTGSDIIDGGTGNDTIT